MTITLQSPSEVAQARYARWLLYGKQGSGKTTFLSTIPRSQKWIVVSADDENVGPLVGHDDHIRVIKVHTWSQVCEVYEMLLKGFAKAESSGKPYYDGVAFDTWTRMQQLAANMVKGYDIAANPEDAMKYVRRAPRLPKGWDEWQNIGALAGEWMRNFMLFPCHLIFTAQEDKFEGKSEMDKPEIKPMLTKWALNEARTAVTLLGRLYTEIHYDEPDGAKPADGEVDVAAIMQAAERSIRDIDPAARERRMLLIGQHDLYVTKGDTQRLGYVVEEPSWDKLAVTLTASKGT